MLSVGPGHIKLLQLGSEVASNIINDPDSQGLPKLLQSRSEKPKSLDALYIICVPRGSYKLPQAGLQVANSPNELDAICMTEPKPDTFLGN